MKLVFLNVWGGQRKDELLSYIEHHAHDTDIFCFQEASEKMKFDCAQLLKDYREISDSKFISYNDNFSQTLFVRKNIKIISSGTLLADDVTVGLAVYAEIEIGGKRAYVCNVHGCARPSEKLDSPGRLHFSAYLIDFFKSKDVPVIIGGDFNLDQTTESVQLFEKHGYRDLIQEFSIETTRNHFAWDKYPGNEMYYSDYVFINEHAQLKNFAVPKDEVSDHLPMVMEVELMPAMESHHDDATLHRVIS